MQQHAIFFSFEGRGDAGKESQRNEALGAASLKISSSHFPSSSGAFVSIFEEGYSRGVGLYPGAVLDC